MFSILNIPSNAPSTSTLNQEQEEETPPTKDRKLTIPGGGAHQRAAGAIANIGIRGKNGVMNSNSTRDVTTLTTAVGALGTLGTLGTGLLPHFRINMRQTMSIMAKLLMESRLRIILRACQHNNGYNRG